MDTKNEVNYRILFELIEQAEAQAKAEMMMWRILLCILLLKWLGKRGSQSNFCWHFIKSKVGLD